MRRVVLLTFLSLEGIAAEPNNSADFIPESTKGDRRVGGEQMALMDSIDTLLLGRVTYTMFAGDSPKISPSGYRQPKPL
jgi:hypothetical protein